jgi:hypothetical protein
MSASYILIDFENVQPKALEQLRVTNVHMHVFLGAKNTKLPRELVLALQSMGERAQYVALATSGANALDFVIAYELGALTAQDRGASFYIVSKDKGFDPLVDLLRSRGLRIGRSTSIEQLPNLVGASTKRGLTKDPRETPSRVVGSKNAAAGDSTPSKVANSGSSATIRKSALTSRREKPSPVGPAQRPAKETRHPAADTAVEDLRERALQSMRARRGGKPTRRKTLLNLLRANFGKDISDTRIEDVYRAMVANGDVVVDGERLSYPALSTVRTRPVRGRASRRTLWRNSQTSDLKP